jgi:hypothetical protein
MMSICKSIAAVGALLGIMSGFETVSAHHSATMFNFTRSETVTGAVKEVRWVNPHVSLTVFGTTKEGDQPSEWLLETTSPGVLGRLGWTRTSFKPGDQVEANIHPLRDAEEHGGLLQNIKSLETGKSFTTNLHAQETLGPD